jgi:hypothetical protein
MLLNTLLETLPDWFKRNEFVNETRTYLNEHPPEDEVWDTLELDQEENPYVRLTHELICWSTSDEERPAEWRLRVFRHRHEMLRALLHHKKRLADRYESGKNLLTNDIEFYSGFTEALEFRTGFGFDEERPWWGPGDPLVNLERIERHRGDTSALEDEGFVRVPHDIYVERVRHRVIRHLLLSAVHTNTTELDLAARMLVLYATHQSTWPKKGSLFQIVSAHKGALLSECQEALTRQHPRLPMKPFYSLPRESNNISTFFVSRSPEAELAVNEDTGVIRSSLEGALSRVVKAKSGQQQLLFFDRDLVARDDRDKADMFVALELDEDRPNVLDALMIAIEKLNIDSNVFEHLPRVCAGVFAAAHRDRRLSFDWDGTFWDTDSGYRLCRIIGFNPENKRHRKRVQDALHLLETLVLHRQIKGRDEKGRKIDMKWSGPLIEPRKAKLELSIEDREGMSEHHSFRSWSIAKALWEMTLPEKDGGTPSFMLIDERAFGLDERSSLPFNLYWTIINRAYMGAYTSVRDDRVMDDGIFKPRLGTLYDWAGMESRRVRVKRLKKRFREALDLMVEQGLLLFWECDELDESRSTAFDSLREARVTVQFSPEQMQHFPRTALME